MIAAMTPFLVGAFPADTILAQIGFQTLQDLGVPRASVVALAPSATAAGGVRFRYTAGRPQPAGECQIHLSLDDTYQVAITPDGADQPSYQSQEAVHWDALADLLRQRTGCIATPTCRARSGRTAPPRRPHRRRTLPHPLLAVLLLGLCSLLAAIELGPVPVGQVIDGDTIDVFLDRLPRRVRLLYIDTPESRSNTHGEASAEGKAASEALRKILPPGSRVTLWGPGVSLETDRYQRLLAVATPAGRAISLQEAQILAGWSPYWRKYGDAATTWPQLHARLLAAEEAARDAKAGAWETDPKYMTDKGNERTTKQGSKPAAGDRPAGE
jgi:endonuclease YncB( thermonuclease family)